MVYTIDLKKIKSRFLLFMFFISLFGFLFFLFFRYYNVKYYDLIKSNSIKYNLEEELLCSVIHAESKFREGSQSHKNAVGLMQIINKTGTWAAEEIGLDDYNENKLIEPKINIEIGSWYLNKLIKQYGNEDTALAAYNAGSGNVSKWLKDERYSDDGVTLHTIPFKETRDYIKRVEINKLVYKFIFKLENL